MPYARAAVTVEAANGVRLGNYRVFNRNVKRVALGQDRTRQSPRVRHTRPSGGRCVRLGGAFFNQRRRHSTIDYLSPANYENAAASTWDGVIRNGASPCRKTLPPSGPDRQGVTPKHTLEELVESKVGFEFGK